MAVFPDSDDEQKNKKTEEEKEACMGEHKARMSITEFENLQGNSRVLKSHAPPNLFLAKEEEDNNNKFKIAKGVKVIYVTRNPFDACVSCYYHPKPGVSPQSHGCPFDAFAKLWLSTNIEFGGWCNHVKEWRKVYNENNNNNGKPPQILWISYEDLVMKPKSSIERIAAFLKIDVTQGDLVDRVMTGCKFENVKQAAQRALDEGTAGNLSHLRRGKIGDWRNHFDNDLKREFEQELSKKFPEGLDYEYNIGDSQKTWKLDAPVCKEE